MRGLISRIVCLAAFAGGCAGTGVPTAQMARELSCDRKHLLELRHRLQERARLGLDRNPLGDAVVEADEMYQNAGEKRPPAPRRRRPAPAAG